MDRSFITNLLKGLVSTSLGSVVTTVFHFLSIMLMTRHVPKDVLGMYFLAFAAVHVLKILAGLGLDLTLSKSVSGTDESTQHDTVASIIAVRLISVTMVGLIFYTAGRFVLPVFDARLNDAIVTMIVYFAVGSFRDLLLYLMQGVQRFKEYAFVEILSAAIRIILLVVYQDRLTLQSLLVIDIVAQFTSFVIQFYTMRGFLFGLSRQNIKVDSARSLTRFGVPLYSNNILTLVYDRSSTFLIGALLNPASVAAYEVALKIPDGFMRLFSSFIIVYFPGISKLFANYQRNDAKKLMRSSLILLSTGIMFFVLVAFLFADEIILALFSSKYLEVSMAFALLMLNFCLRAISNILGYSLVAAGYSSAPVKANIAASAVNIIGGLVLIHFFGYIGAVCALLLMNVTSQIIYQLLLRGGGLAPDPLAYLKPFFLVAAALGIYWLFDADSILLRLLLLSSYIAGSLLFIKEIKAISHSAARHIFGPKAHSESA